jgi:hypothetical protein
MSFNVGLLEMIGYLVPGGVAVAAWLWLQNMLPLNPAGKMGGTAGLALALLASYVVGQLLTFGSSILKFKRPANPYETEPFKSVFVAAFGKNVPDGSSYHLLRGLVVHHSKAHGERVERYFALMILTRNLTLACGGVAAVLLLSTELVWAALWAAAAIAFYVHYSRFLKTEAMAVFGAAAVILMTGKNHDAPIQKPAEPL